MELDPRLTGSGRPNHGGGRCRAHRRHGRSSRQGRQSQERESNRTGNKSPARSESSHILFKLLMAPARRSATRSGRDLLAGNHPGCRAETLALPPYCPEGGHPCRQRLPTSWCANSASSVSTNRTRRRICQTRLGRSRGGRVSMTCSQPGVLNAGNMSDSSNWANS